MHVVYRLLCALPPLLVASCVKPLDPGARCHDTRSTFAHRGLVPPTEPGGGRPPELTEPETTLDDHDHGDASEAGSAAWTPGAPAVGRVVVAAEGQRLVVADGWRPARSRGAAWTMSDAPPEAFVDADASRWLGEVARGRVPPDLAPVLWWDGPAVGALGQAARRDARAALSAFRRGLGEVASVRCVDAVCAVPVRGEAALRVVVFAEGRPDAVLLRWLGDGATLSALLREARAPREGLQHRELGEILSIEEGLRLTLAHHRLRALAPLAPENPFITYFLARNAAARGAREEALAGLTTLAGLPTARALAARLLAERHAEWEPYRSEARYLALLTPSTRTIPIDLAIFAAWLVRHRGSAPHLEVAVLPGGPPWFELEHHLEAAARLPLRPPLVGATPEQLVWDTPRGPLTLTIGRDADGLPGLRDLEAPPPVSGAERSLPP